MVQSTSVCLSQHGPTAANLLFAVVGQWAGDNTRLLHCQYSAAAAVCGGLCRILSIHEAEYRHTHTRAFNGPFSGTTRVSRYQKGKTNLDFTEARFSGSGISWAICKSAPRSRQIAMPAPHRSVFYSPDALPAAQPTASKHWRHKHWRLNTDLYIICVVCSLLESKREADRCGQSKWNLCSVRSEAAGEAFCNSCQQSVLWRQLACVW